MDNYINNISANLKLCAEDIARLEVIDLEAQVRAYDLLDAILEDESGDFRSSADFQMAAEEFQQALDDHKPLFDEEKLRQELSKVLSFLHCLLLFAVLPILKDGFDQIVYKKTLNFHFFSRQSKKTPALYTKQPIPRSYYKNLNRASDRQILFNAGDKKPHHRTVKALFRYHELRQKTTPQTHVWGINSPIFESIQSLILCRTITIFSCFKHPVPWDMKL